MARFNFLIYATIAMLVLASCGPDNKNEPSIASVQKGAQSFAASTAKPAAAHTMEKMLEMAGIKDPDHVKVFLKDLQDGLRDNNKEVVASFLRYPFKIYKNGAEKRSYASKEEFLPDYDKFFTKDVKDAVQKTEFDDLFVNSKGVMIGNGEIWMSGWDENMKPGPVKIIAIQPPDKTKKRKKP